MDHSLPNPGHPVDPGPAGGPYRLADVIAEVVDAYLLGLLTRRDRASGRHRPWCDVAQHDPLADRCVSSARDASPSLSTWLVAAADQDPRLVVDVPLGGAELTVREARSHARQVVELLALAVGGVPGTGEPPIR
ncbi:MAG: hypothetical protein ACRC35_03135 [Angustibacter sp.]